MLRTIFCFPAAIRPFNFSRSAVLSSPSTIRPSSATTEMPSTSWLVNFKVMRPPGVVGERLRVATVPVEHGGQSETVRKETLVGSSGTARIQELYSCNRCCTGQYSPAREFMLIVTGILTSPDWGTTYETHECIHRLAVVGRCSYCTGSGSERSEGARSQRAGPRLRSEPQGLPQLG